MEMERKMTREEKVSAGQKGRTSVGSSARASVQFLKVEVAGRQEKILRARRHAE